MFSKTIPVTFIILPKNSHKSFSHRPLLTYQRVLLRVPLHTLGPSNTVLHLIYLHLLLQTRSSSQRMPTLTFMSCQCLAQNLSITRNQEGINKTICNNQEGGRESTLLKEHRVSKYWVKLVFIDWNAYHPLVQKWNRLRQTIFEYIANWHTWILANKILCPSKLTNCHHIEIQMRQFWASDLQDKTFFSFVILF